MKKIILLITLAVGAFIIPQVANADACYDCYAQCYSIMPEYMWGICDGICEGTCNPPPCTPSCTGKCGGASDGCGGTCDAACDPPSCTPSCIGKCGGASDGCGGTCDAACDPPSCTPSCTGALGTKVCGSNGCDGVCGIDGTCDSFGPEYYCGVNGTCIFGGCLEDFCQTLDGRCIVSPGPDDLNCGCASGGGGMDCTIIGECTGDCFKTAYECNLNLDCEAVYNVEDTTCGNCTYRGDGYCNFDMIGGAQETCVTSPEDCGVAVCTPGETQSCGSGECVGTQDCKANSCGWENCESSGSCGFCGYCSGGACQGSGCAPGSENCCVDNNEVQTCNASCDWGSCSQVDGKCGYVANVPPDQPGPPPPDGGGGDNGGGGGGGNPGTGGIPGVISGVTWNNCLFKGKSTPTFYWTYNDPDGDPQTAYEVRIDDNAGFPSGSPDPGEFTASGGASTSFTPIPADWSEWVDWNTNYWWIVRVKDSNNAWSEWSDALKFKSPQSAYPWPDFTWLPESPAQGEVAVFDPEEEEVFYLWTVTEGEEQYVDDTGPTNEEPHIIFLSSINKIKLKVTDSDAYSCESDEQELTAAFPLPEYKEIPPITWFKNFFIAVSDFFNGFLSFN